MAEQALTEFDVDPVGGVRQGIGAQILQRHVEQADDRQAADQHEQGRIAAMGQDLVDHHLEEQGRHQGENLHEESGDQHMDERLAVAPQRRREPAKAKGARIDARAEEIARDQDEGRLDFRREPVDRQFARHPRYGIDDAQQARRGLPGKQEIAAGLEPKDRRGGRAGRGAPETGARRRAP